jgi:hypothetical protein
VALWVCLDVRVTAYVKNLWELLDAHQSALFSCHGRAEHSFNLSIKEYVMSNQRAIKKQLMKNKELGTKKIEHFFHKGKKIAQRETSMVGALKFKRAAGR